MRLDALLRELPHAELVMLRDRLNRMLGPWVLRSDGLYTRLDLKGDIGATASPRHESPGEYVVRPCSGTGGVQRGPLASVLAHVDAHLEAEGKLLMGAWPWPDFGSGIFTYTLVPRAGA